MNKTYWLIACTLVVFLVSLASISCEPVIQVNVTNKTSEALTVYAIITVNTVSGLPIYSLGSVQPGETINEQLGMPLFNLETINIYAKNNQGVTVFDETFTRDEFNQMKYKIIISELNP